MTFAVHPLRLRLSSDINVGKLGLLLGFYRLRSKIHRSVVEDYPQDGLVWYQWSSPNRRQRLDSLGTDLKQRAHWRLSSLLQEPLLLACVSSDFLGSLRPP